MCDRATTAHDKVTLSDAFEALTVDGEFMEDNYLVTMMMELEDDNTYHCMHSDSNDRWRFN